MTSFLAVLAPTCIVAATALIVLAAEPFLRIGDKHRRLPWIGAIGLLLAGVVQYLLADGAVHDLHGVLVLDPIRAWLAIAVLAAGALGIAGLQQSLGRERHPGGEPYALLLLATTGALLMVAANDGLALVCGLELASIAVYAAVGLRRGDLDSQEGLFKYLVMGAVFSAVLLYGLAMIYGATGTTQFGNRALIGREGIFALGYLLVMVGLLFKIGAVPFHFWSPDAYTGAPVAVTGFMAAVMKVGGLAAIGALWLNLAGVAGGEDAGIVPLDAVMIVSSEMAEGFGRLGVALVSLGVLSLLLGNFSALGQTHLRRLMAYSSIAHVGYMLLLFGWLEPGTTIDLGPLWYYLVGYAVAAAGVMTCATVLVADGDRDPIEGLTGTARLNPFVGLVMTVLVASLAGLPPTAGFVGKYLIFAGLVERGEIAVALVGVVMAVVGVGYYLRLVVAIWSRKHEILEPDRQRGLGAASVVVAGVAVLVLAVLPGLILTGEDDAPPRVAEVAGPDGDG